MSQVSIVKCDDYQQERVDQAVRESLDLIGGIKDLVHKGDRVLLKVNMLLGSKPEVAATTHPAVVKAVIQAVREAGGIPLIGDSPGNAYANVDKAYEDSGFRQAAEEMSAEIVKFESAGSRAIDVVSLFKGEDLSYLSLNGRKRVVKTIHISKEVLDADVVISLPKLKTQNYTLFTGAIKNMYGAVPGFRKKEFHRLAPRPVDFATLLVDIFVATKPRLAIMDGIVGMEGHGPAGGDPRFVGIIAASTDCVSLDAVCSAIISLDPMIVDTTRIAFESGLGEARLDRIEIKGTPWHEVKVDDYKLSTNVNVWLTKAPGLLLAILKPLAKWCIKVRPRVNPEKCVRCQICVKNCPVQAMREVEVKNKKVPYSSMIVIDYRKCIQCFCCHEVCPHKAVEINRNWLARKWEI